METPIFSLSIADPKNWMWRETLEKSTIQYPQDPMGRTVYLPIHGPVDFYGKLVGKYTIVPWILWDRNIADIILTWTWNIGTYTNRNIYQHISTCCETWPVYQMVLLAINIKHSKPENCAQYGVDLLATAFFHHLESEKLLSCMEGSTKKMHIIYEYEKKVYIYKHKHVYIGPCLNTVTNVRVHIEGS